MSYHRNFTAGYDTRGRTDSVSENSYINRPEYPLADINGYADAPFRQRYYDRRGIDYGTPPVEPTFSTWDAYAAADPAYFYAMYGTPYDPMYTSRDGIQAPYWGMEYAEVPKTRMRYLANWIGKRLWRNGRRGQPGWHYNGGPDTIEAMRAGDAIMESQLPTPYVLVLGDRGRAGIKQNRLVQIPAGALVIYLSNPKWCRRCQQWEEIIEDVTFRSGSTYGSS